MTLLLPIGLLALLALPIIIYLYMRAERRRRVVVSSLLLWEKLPRAQPTNRTRLPLTWLLLAHLIIAALIAAALSRPQIALPVGDADQVAIVLDTSVSMTTRDGGQERFNVARARMAGALGNATRATLVVADAAPRVVASGSPATVIAAAATLSAGGVGSDLTGALALAEAAIDPQRSGRIVIITDGATATPVTRAVSVPVEYLQIGALQPNRAITAFAAKPFGRELRIYARIANVGEQPFNGQITLFADDVPIDDRLIAIPADGAADQIWSVAADVGHLRLVVAGGDTLAADDTAYLSVAAPVRARALLVSSAPAALARALRAVPTLDVTTVTPAEYDPTSAPDLTIFHDTVPEPWPARGAVLLVAPRSSEWLTAAPIAADDAPGAITIKRGFAEDLSIARGDLGNLLAISAPDGFTTLLGTSDVPLVVRGEHAGRPTTIWAFDPNLSPLTSRLAFPLLTARSVRDLLPAPIPSTVASGQFVPFAVPAGTSALRLIGAQYDEPLVIASGGFIAPRSPGLYRITAGESVIAQFGTNAGAQAESDLRPRAEPVFTLLTTGRSGSPRSAEIWIWPALVALLLLLGEWVLVQRRRPVAAQG